MEILIFVCVYLKNQPNEELVQVDGDTTTVVRVTTNICTTHFPTNLGLCAKTWSCRVTPVTLAVVVNDNASSVYKDLCHMYLLLTNGK